MDDKTLNELPFRLDAAEAFLKAMARNLRALKLEPDEWEMILASFEELCPSDNPKQRFFRDEILGWFDGGAAQAGDAAGELLSRAELRRKLFGPDRA